LIELFARIMSQTTEKRSRFARLGRWVAELVLVFVGVYAAFWLNSYQQHRQDAQRRDQILASLEQEFLKGIESGKSIAREKNDKRPSSGAGSTPVRCRRCIPLFLRLTTVRVTSPRSFNRGALNCST